MSEDPIKNTILTATTVSPDLSFVRYQFDEFKNTKARQVPLEEIDYSIYKSSSNCVAFTTTEERIILWIKAMYSRYYAQSLDETETNYYRQMKTCWAEQPAHNDNTKCEKITLNLSISGKKSHENIVTIFIYCSTGRIQIQGRSVRVWGDNEFNELKALVDGNSAETTRNLKKFIEIVKQPQPSTAPNEKCDNNEQSSCVEASEDASVDETQDIPTPKCFAEKDESFSTMKVTVSNLESEFISFKQETYKMFEDMSLALKEKDNKINLLQQRIISLEACSELLYKQHTNNDCLSEKQHKLDKKINNALRRCSKLEEEKSSRPISSVVGDSQESVLPTDALNTQPDNNSTTPITVTDSTTNQSAKDNSTYPTIPTRNRFSPLRDETTESTPQSAVQDPDPPNDKITITAETIIMCDSNGHKLNTSLLCPNSPTAYIRCPTIKNAKTVLEKHHLTNPKTIILHSGTNDIEKESINTVCENTKTLLNDIKSKYPKARIILSSLLPRSDHLLQKAISLNDLLAKISLPNITLISHTNLFRSTMILYDRKHLNNKGIKMFAKNLKSAYFGTTSKPWKRPHRPQPPISHHSSHTFPHPTHPKHKTTPFTTQPQHNKRSPLIPPEPPYLPNAMNPHTWNKSPQDDSVTQKIAELIKLLKGFVH